MILIFRVYMCIMIKNKGEWGRVRWPTIDDDIERMKQPRAWVQTIKRSVVNLYSIIYVFYRIIFHRS